MIPPVTDDLLVDAVASERMAAAGLAYFREGRVSGLDVDARAGIVSGLVRGSGMNVYVTSIVFEEGDGYPDSECSCPVGYACKHVAAVLHALHEHRTQGAARLARLEIAVSPGAAPAFSNAVREWLQADTLAHLGGSVRYEPVCFTIEPANLFKQQTGRRKSGAATAGAATIRALTIRAWRRSAADAPWRRAYSWNVQHDATCIEPEARRLLARMTPVAVGGDFTGDGIPHGSHGWRWLRDAADAGLLRWKSSDGPVVAIAMNPLAASLRWQALEGERLTVTLDVPGAIEDADASTIFAGDPVLIYNPGRAELGFVETGIAPALAGRLLAMPPLDPTDIAMLAPRWTEIAGTALPPPRSPDIAQIAGIAPRPVLRFVVDKVKRRTSYRGWHTSSRTEAIELARLEFDYADHRVDATTATAEAIVRVPAGIAHIVRDLAAEQRAVDRLARTSLRPLALTSRSDIRPAQAWDHAITLCEEGTAATEADTFPDFLVNEAQALEAEGWLLEYAPRWPHVYLPPAADENPPQLAAVTSPVAASTRKRTGAIDWFDIELAAHIDGQRVDVLPALRRVLAENGESLLARGDDHRIALPLDDGRFTAMRLGTVRPLLASLLRMALADRDGATLRLNRHDLGTVQELVATGLPWVREDKLRTLAAALDPGADSAAWPQPTALAADLRLYQRAGCTWLGALHEAGMGGILADDMGLGKTLQAIAHVLHVRQQAGHKQAAQASPVLIVAPTSVLPNWQAELARFAPGLAPLLWHGPGRHAALGERLPEAELVITSYPLLARDAELLARREYVLVVLDEAHALKNPRTAGFKAAAALKARQVVALTGTPIENRLTDLWSLASLTNPGLLGTFESFGKTWRNPIEKQGDLGTQSALARRMRPFMLRRTKDEVAADLPPKTIIPERIELSEPQFRLYESQRLLMQARVREEIDRVGLMRSQIVVLDAMLKLRQICCDPALLPRDLGQNVGSAKRVRLLEMIDELVGEGRRTIVFSQFTTMLDLVAADLDRAGIAYEQLRGTTRDRARPVARFQSGEVPLILVSLKAGGAGINLTAADTVILYDPWWNPAVEAQAIDRAHRIGQAKPIFVHRLIATGTIEEKILALQARKQDLADMLWNDEARAGPAGLSDEDIAFLLG